MSKLRLAMMVVGGGVALVGIAVGAAVAYAASTADAKLQFPDTPNPAVQASTDPEVIARGRYLVHGPAHCAQCHSTDDRDHPEKIADSPLTGGLAFEMGPLGTRYAANLTPHATGIGGLSDAQVARTIQTGVTHTGELSFFMLLSAAKPADEDVTAIISYLRSLPPAEKAVPSGEWYLFGKVLLTYAFAPMEPVSTPGPRYVPEGPEPSVERGQYLSDSVALCSTCHTEADPTSFRPVGPKAGGSLPDPSHGTDTHMEFVAPNLTSHATGITGQLDEEAFVQRLRAGRRYASSIMPWENFANLTDGDARSIYRYLKSLPPVDQDRGPTYRTAGWKPGDPSGA